MADNKVHHAKIKEVKNLSEIIQKSKTFMIVSIKGLPSKQFQAIKKSIREEATIKVAKKNIILRALKELGKDSLNPLNEYIKEDIALVVSDLEGFELAVILSKKKNPIFAKAGQTAPDDIEIKAGPTDLVPGPAISELGSLGLQVAVENGKIAIKASKVVLNKGRMINESAASILQKLNIKPFSVGLTPIAFYDTQTEKIFKDIKINPEELAENLANSTGKALGFAQKIVYYCEETIGYFLAKANAEGSRLNELSPKEAEEKTPEKSEKKETEEKPDEENKDKSKGNKVEEK